MLRDHLGEVIVTGRVRKELVENFLGASSLPAWLTSDAGTVSFVSAVTDKGSVRVTTAATDTAAGRIKTAFSLATSQFTAVMLTVEGFMLDTATNGTAALKLAGTNVGVGLQHNSNVTEAKIRVYRAGGSFDDVATHTILRQASAHRQNVSLLLLPRPKDVYVLSDDQVIAYSNVAANTYTDGTITPTVEVVAAEAVAHYMQIEQIRLTTWSN